MNFNVFCMPNRSDMYKLLFSDNKNIIFIHTKRYVCVIKNDACMTKKDNEKKMEPNFQSLYFMSLGKG